MRRRVSIVLTLSALVLVVPMSGSSAGGGNWIEFDRPLTVGKRVVAHNRFFDRADALDPPYFAYLIPGPVNAFPVPLGLHRDAAVLGRAEITWPGPNTGWTGTMQNNPLLRVEATIPDIAPGNYIVSICNRPCTDLLKDVHPTSVKVYGTPLEARLTARIDALERRVVDLRYDARRDRRHAEKSLRRDVGDTAERLDAEVNDLERELAGLNTGLSNDSSPWAEIALAGLIALALGLGGGMLVGRRRRLPIDWDQLLEEARKSDPVRS